MHGRSRGTTFCSSILLFVQCSRRHIQDVRPALTNVRVVATTGSLFRVEYTRLIIHPLLITEEYTSIRVYVYNIYISNTYYAKGTRTISRFMTGDFQWQSSIANTFF